MPTTYAIPNGRTVMGAFTYTGNGASSSNTTQNITTPFYPDFTWVKARSDGSYYHRLTSTGFTLPNYLSSNSSDAEGTLNDQISALASTYFQVKASGGGGTNQSGVTYVGWAWNANSGSTVTNTAGSITSTVSVNATAGFSVITYTGNGSAGATVGHGLGVAPNFVLIKCRSNIANWFVGGSNVATAGNGTWSSVLDGLNTTAVVNTGATAVFNSTAPSSSVITLGSETNANGSGRTFVIYAWAAVDGYSSFGTWQNNNSNDGTFIYLGFRPRFILLKNTDNVENWFIWDSTRQTYNVAPPSNNWLNPNQTNAEGANLATTAEIDGLSNGFKIRTTNPATGEISFGTRTYIYAAFAENPFKYANAR